MIVPIGMRWTSILTFTLAADLMLVLVDAREEFAGQSIAQRLKPFNLALFVTVEHSINIFSKPLRLFGVCPLNCWV